LKNEEDEIVEPFESELLEFIQSSSEQSYVINLLSCLPGEIRNDHFHMKSREPTKLPSKDNLIFYQAVRCTSSNSKLA